ncbi:MAG: MFS transporter [Longimicrobiales bacterium]
MSTIDAEIGTTAGELLVAGEHVITRRSVASWVMYDLANTIFSMGVVSAFFPAYVRAGRPASADVLLGNITSVSMAIIFVASPLLGAMTDRARRRVPFLIASTLICVLLTAFMGHVQFGLTATLFILANIAYQAGLQFYDALLPEVTTEANRGKVGGIGVGIGYLGSYIAIGLGFVVAKDSPWVFTYIALLFLLFAIPAFLFVKERGNPRPQPFSFRMIVESTRETIRTLRESQRYPGLLRFLIGRMFYTDAINTVITFMLVFTTNMAIATAGLTEKQAQDKGFMVMAIAITFAVFGGFAWGWLSDRIGPKRTLNYVLYIWIVIFTAAALIGIETLPLWTMYVLGSAAGLAMGGVWAADRPYMLRLTPPARIGEFYGLYGMVGRFSAITGPFLFGNIAALVVTRSAPGLNRIETARIAAHSEGVAMVSLLLMVVVSYFILRRVTDSPRIWTGSDLIRS